MNKNMCVSFFKKLEFLIKNKTAKIKTKIDKKIIKKL